MTDKLFKPRMILREGQPLTTSLAVAEFFGKRHNDVLRAIRNLDCSPEYHQRNFALVKETINYADSDGMPQTKETDRTSHYELARDGFVFLAMGFTGPAAARFKEAYIEAFNAMERMLAEQREEAIWAQAEADRNDAVALAHQVVAEMQADALAEAGKLTAVQVAGRMRLPPWRTQGGYLSEAFMLMFFALERRFTDAALLWTLYDEFACHLEPRTLSAQHIAGASGWALCRGTVYLSRQRLIARGLLLNQPATEWRIQRELFEKMMRETQLVAHVRRTPVILPEAHGLNQKLAKWMERTATTTVQ